MVRPPLLRIAAGVFVALSAVLLLGPLVLVVVGVSVSQGRFVAFPPNGFSLGWYRAVLGSEACLSAAWLSLRLAILVTVSATLAGGAAAIAIHRRRLPGFEAMATFFLSPLMLPTSIYAIGMLMRGSLPFGAVSPAALRIAHTVIAAPCVVRTTLAVLADSDPHPEEAAATLGAGRRQRLALVVLPQTAPGLAAGAFFAFDLSFDEAVVSLFLRRPGLNTLPVHIYTQLEFSPDPSVAAVSTIVIARTVALIVVIDRVRGLRKAASG